jgi:hypothetical protein
VGSNQRSAYFASFTQDGGLVYTKSDREVQNGNSGLHNYGEPAKLGDQLVGLLTFFGEVTPLNGWGAVARAAKKHLKDAGFDLYRLGMTGIC